MNNKKKYVSKLVNDMVKNDLKTCLKVLERRKIRRFKGWDWTELANYYNIEHNVPKTIKEVLQHKESEPFKRFLVDNWENKEVEKTCRIFLNYLLKGMKDKYDFSIFYSLSKIKNSFTFMNYFIILFPNMWC